MSAEVFPDRLRPDAPVHPSLPAARRLVVCDIENLIGGSSAPYQFVAGALDALDRLISRSSSDVRLVGAGPTMTATLARAGVTSVVFGRGVSGADRALARHLCVELVAGCFSSVQLASGDAEFVPAVAALAEVGVPTDVWARPGTISAALTQVARSVSYIDHLRTAA